MFLEKDPLSLLLIERLKKKSNSYSKFKDDKDKLLPLVLSATSKAFHCKETSVHVNTDNSQKCKWNFCEKKDSIVFTKPSSDMSLESFIEYRVNGKRNLSSYKSTTATCTSFQKHSWCREV